MRRSVFSVCLASLLTAGVFAGEAHAATISLASGTSSSFDIFWSQLVGTTELTALGEFDVTLTDGYADFAIRLTNNTSLVTEKIHAIGFDTDPNATSLTNAVAGSYFQNFSLSQNFPSFNRIDVCAWGAQNCAGGGQASNIPGGGTADTFGFRLNGDFSEGLTLTNFAIKFQGDLGSFEFNDTPPPPPQVPEPASLIVLAAGAVMTIAGTRRRRLI